MAMRTVFFLSDQTGVTAETLGHSLITQFSAKKFRQMTLPFIDTEDKAREAVRTINAEQETGAPRPIVFSTLVQEEYRAILKEALLRSASAFLLFHTHPSGDPSPSSEDLSFTRRMAEAGELVGVKLVDHIVLGSAGRWVSLGRRGAW